MKKLFLLTLSLALLSLIFSGCARKNEIIYGSDFRSLEFQGRVMSIEDKNRITLLVELPETGEGEIIELPTEDAGNGKTAVQLPIIEIDAEQTITETTKEGETTGETTGENSPAVIVTGDGTGERKEEIDEAPEVIEVPENITEMVPENGTASYTKITIVLRDLSVFEWPTGAKASLSDVGVGAVMKVILSDAETITKVILLQSGF